MGEHVVHESGGYRWLQQLDHRDAEFVAGPGPRFDGPATISPNGFEEYHWNSPGGGATFLVITEQGDVRRNRLPYFMGRSVPVSPV